MGGGNLLAQTEYDWEIIYEKEGVVLNVCDNWKFDRIVAMGDNGAVLRSYNKGEIWEDVSDASLGNITCMDLVDNDTIFASNGYDVFRSFDFGDSWEKVLTTTGKINQVEANFMWHETVCVAGENATIFLSTTYGDTWRNPDVNDLLNNLDMHGIRTSTYQGDTTYVLNTSDAEELVITESFTKVFREREWGDKAISRVKYFGDEANGLYGGWYAFIYEDNSVGMRDNSGTIGWSFNNAEETINSVAGYPVFMNDTKKAVNFAIGYNGYIMKAKSWGSKNMVDDNSSPTNNDLNWIDMGMPGHYNKKYDYWTMSVDTLSFIVVGDGVILRKRFNWEPDPVSVYENTTTTIFASVFPNPSNGSVNVVVPNNEGVLNVTLYSINGVELRRLQTKGSKMELSNLISGVYLVNIKTRNGSETKRLFVK